MAKLKDVIGYHHASDILSKRDRLKLGHNTWLERVPPMGAPSQQGKESFQIVYHQTPVVTYYADGTIFLNTGGWDTVTTRQRLGHYLSPHGFSCHRIKGRTRITDRAKGWENAPFKDFVHQANINPATREIRTYT